jgi:Ser/Thr protein kinase RdoA (MazF antagonist)
VTEQPRDDEVPYARLTPDVILTAVESCGFACNGSVLALASYENRVYQMGTDDGFVVVKFYRPGRWSTDGILEEHDFALELAAREIPVVPPLVRHERTLHEHDGYRFAVYERRGGRWPELGTSEERVWLGRFLGRLHAVGGVRRFSVRATLSREELGQRSVEHVLAGDWLPPHLVESYERITEQLLDAVEQCFLEAGNYRELRIHGDCHRGNVLWTEQGPHFVDLDDCVNGPAVQDLWLFLAGSRDEMAGQLGDWSSVSAAQLRPQRESPRRRHARANQHGLYGGRKKAGELQLSCGLRPRQMTTESGGSSSAARCSSNDCTCCSQ